MRQYIKLFPLINPAEKRFIRSWQEQREGGKWSYFLLYSFAGAFIIALFTYILLLWFLQVRVPRPFWIIPTFSLIAGAVIAVLSWRINENRFRKIIRREVSQGREN